jgi:hypothetical protein
LDCALAAVTASAINAAVNNFFFIVRSATYLGALVLPADESCTT